MLDIISKSQSFENQFSYVLGFCVPAINFSMKEVCMPLKESCRPI